MYEVNMFNQKLVFIDENTKSLNVDKLLDKMAVQPLERIKTARGEFNEDLTPDKICERLLERYDEQPILLA